MNASTMATTYLAAATKAIEARAAKTQTPANGCPRCHGRGQVYSRIDCEVCHGRGLLPNGGACWRCGGHGSYWAWATCPNH